MGRFRRAAKAEVRALRQTHKEKKRESTEAAVGAAVLGKGRRMREHFAERTLAKRELRKLRKRREVRERTAKAKVAATSKESLEALAA